MGLPAIAQRYGGTVCAAAMPTDAMHQHAAQQLSPHDAASASSLDTPEPPVGPPAVGHPRNHLGSPATFFSAKTLR